ncbi:integrase core domain-containing protein [Burkholderia pseudomallei]|uniref:integrase core domain-containing protein n=1 Tax=Burkholderia pseudomallei TaxID=28450 RepID=UPI003984DA5E
MLGDRSRWFVAWRTRSRRAGSACASSSASRSIKADNGSEFISKALDKWAYENGVEIDFSRPGKPTDNAKNESFNGRFREECLNAHWFLSLEDARRKIEVWREYYNEARPHSALQWMTPAEFARQCTGRAGSARPEEPEFSN